MKLSIFNRGLNLKDAPHLLKEGEGTVYQNIDNAAGHFKPTKTKIVDNTITVSNTFGYYDTLNDVWRFSAEPNDWVLYGNNLYTSDRINQPQKISSANVTNNLGINAPTIDTVSVNITELPSYDSRPWSVEETNTNDNFSEGTEIHFLAVNVRFFPTGQIGNPLVFNYNFAKAISDADRTAINNGTIVGTSLLNLVPHQVYTVRNSAAIRVTNSRDSAGFLYVYNTATQRFALKGTYAPGSSTIISAGDLTILGRDPLELGPFLGSLVGNYQYLLTYYNINDGAESGPSNLIGQSLDIPEELPAIPYSRIELTNLPVSPDPQVTHKYLYRIGGDSRQITQVTRLDNATTSYTDDRQELLPTVLLQTENYLPAPAGLKYLVEQNAMLFGAVGPYLRFTPVDKPNAWPELFFLTFPEDITGVAVVQIGLLVFTELETYLINGNSPTTLSKQLLSKDQGCLNHDTIANVKSSAVWQSYDGICASNGSTPIVITRNALDKPSFDSVQAVVWNEQYWLQLNDGSCFVWDYRFSSVMKTIAENLDSLAVANGKLYGFANSTAYSLFEGSTNNIATYRTGKLYLASIIQEKLLDAFFVNAEPGVTISLYINGSLAASKTTSKQGSDKFKIPKEYTRYTYVEFEITGAAELYELIWIDESANS